MSDLTIADVLDKAADLIEPKGRWTQGYWARDHAYGNRVAPTDPKAKCFCALGAVMAACNENSPYNPASRHLLKVIAADGYHLVSNWNDAPRRTQAEVVAKLREAARIAREAEVSHV